MFSVKLSGCSPKNAKNWDWHRFSYYLPIFMWIGFRLGTMLQMRGPWLVPWLQHASRQGCDLVGGTANLEWRSVLVSRVISHIQSSSPIFGHWSYNSPEIQPPPRIDSPPTVAGLEREVLLLQRMQWLLRCGDGLSQFGYLRNGGFNQPARKVITYLNIRTYVRTYVQCYIQYIIYIYTYTYIHFYIYFYTCIHTVHT